MLNKPDNQSQAVVKRIWRKRSGEGHAGAWKVAFADFCLALLCLFLVMWLMAVREQQQLSELLKAAGGSVLDIGRGRISESLGTPRGSLIAREIAPRQGDVIAQRKLYNGSDVRGGVAGARLSRIAFETSAELAELGEILSLISEQTGLRGNLHWLVTPYGLRVMLHDTQRQGMFERGSAVPSEPFRELLRRMGPLFSRIENQMLIVGHTDSLPYPDRGPDGFSNWTLSSERALAARSYLIAGGMPASSVLQVVGLADGAPLNPDNPAADENRRIELLILTKGQARGISAMFGAPGETQPLIDGAVTSLPDREALAALRNELTPPAP